MRRIKDIISIGSADIVGLGISAVFWFYLATQIIPSEYGEIHYFIGIATIGSAFSLIGTQHTITVYTAKKNNVVSTLFFVSLICSIGAGIVIFILVNRIDVSILAILIIFFTLGVGTCLGQKNYKKYATYFIIQRILMVTFGLISYFSFGVEGILFGIAASYLVYTKLIIDGVREFKIDFSLFKPNRKFITNNYLMMVTNGVNTQIDKLLIAPILGFTILGNYSLALQVIALLTIAPGIIFKYVVPQDASGIPSEKLRKQTILFSIGLSIIGICVSPLLIPIFFEQYTEVVMIIQIMSLVTIPITISLFYFSKFLALEQSKFTLIGGLIKISVMVSSIIVLGSFYGIIGMAISFVLASTIECIYFHYSYKKLESIAKS